MKTERFCVAETFPFGIHPDRKKELEKDIDDIIEHIVRAAGRCNKNLNQADNEVCIFSAIKNKYDSDEIQYMYDYLRKTYHTKQNIVLPYNGLVSLMSIEELRLWAKKLNKFLDDIDNSK